MKSNLGFDPRAVPWTLQAGHWPQLSQATLQANALKKVFQNPPVWTPEIKREPNFGQRTPLAAAVLIPIVLRGPEGSEPHVLLTQRTQHLSTHAGQIAFPGGKVDAQDPSAEHAALREAHEEVGLEPHWVDVLGTLPHYVTGTAFHITPVVGLVSPQLNINANPHEVADVFEVPLSFLMDPSNHRYHEFERDGALRHWYSMPYNEPPCAGHSDFKERFIWGATAGMIRNLYRFLLAANSL